MLNHVIGRVSVFCMRSGMLGAHSSLPLATSPNLAHELWLFTLPVTSSLFYFYFPCALISSQSLFHPTVLHLLLKLPQVLLQNSKSCVNEHQWSPATCSTHFILLQTFKPIPIITASDHEVSSSFLCPSPPQSQCSAPLFQV